MNNSEEIVPLTLDAGDMQKENLMHMVFNVNNITQMRNEMDSSDGSPESVHFQQENLNDHDDDYIEWSLIGENLILKRQEFRQQIDLYKSYSNHHHSITRLLTEIIDYYIKEYLAHEEHFSADQINRLEQYFQKAIKEKNYLKYFVLAFTSHYDFFHVLNKHLALHILDYFDLYAYSSVTNGYRLINCLVYIVTLLIHHPDFEKYQYKGITYRGLIMTENTLEQYSIGNQVLNRAFVSTSKNRAIAELFACIDEQNVLEQTSDARGVKKVPVLLRYTIKQNQTAINITNLSKISDEEEVLILPFSVFQVKHRTNNCLNIHAAKLIEIELEECEDGEQINNEEQAGKRCSEI